MIAPIRFASSSSPKCARRLVVHAVGDAATQERRHGLGQGQRRALALVEGRVVPPGGDAPDLALVLAGRAHVARVQVDAVRAAVQLRGAQLDELAERWVEIDARVERADRAVDGAADGGVADARGGHVTTIRPGTGPADRRDLVPVVRSTRAATSSGEGARMARVTLDGTGVLSVAGKKLFPLGLSNPPPLGKKAPSGKQGLAEVAEGGISLMRTGLETWAYSDFDAQIAQQKALLDGAAAAGLLCWLWLGNAASHPVDPASVPGEAHDGHRQELQEPSRSRRLEGRGRAREPAARRVQDPGRAAHPRLQEAEDARPRAAARDHPGPARDGSRASCPIGRPSTSRAPTSTRSRTRRARTRTRTTPTSRSSAT